MKKVITYFFLMMGFLSFAQSSLANGYKITLDTRNLNGSVLRLVIYSGSKKNEVKLDSVKVTSDKQQALFTRRKGIITIPAYIQVNDNKNSECLFLLRNDQNITGTIDGSKEHNVEWTDSLDMKFIAYQEESNRQKKEELSKELQGYHDEGLNLYLKMNERLDLKNEGNNTEFATKYFDGIDLNSKNIVAYPNTYHYINHFYENVPYKFATTEVLGSKGCSSRNFGFYWDWLTQNLVYIYTTGQDVDSLISYLYTNYIPTNSCANKYGGSLDDAVLKINAMKNFPEGERFTNFDFEEIDGTTDNFWDFLIKNPYPTVLVFFDPDCSHCQHDVPMKAKILKQMEEQYHQKYNKVAILFWGDDGRWRQFISDHDMGDWINVKSQKGKEQIYRAVRIDGTPSYFILDKNGKIISRDFNDGKLIKEMEKE